MHRDLGCKIDILQSEVPYITCKIEAKYDPRLVFVHAMFSIVFVFDIYISPTIVLIKEIFGPPGIPFSVLEGF